MARYSQDSYGQDRYGSTYVPFSTAVVATVVASCERVRNSGALAAGATVVVTEAFSTVRGAGAFSSNATTTAACERIQHGGATSTVASTITGACERVREAAANDGIGISSIAIAVERVLLVSATMTSTTTITAKGGYVRFGEATATPTASVIAVGRLKWSPIAEGEEVWTPIVNDSVTWTEIAA